MPTRPLESEWAGPAEAPPPGSSQSHWAPGSEKLQPREARHPRARTIPSLLGGKAGPTRWPHGPQALPAWQAAGQGPWGRCSADGSGLGPIAPLLQEPSLTLRPSLSRTQLERQGRAGWRCSPGREAQLAKPVLRGAVGGRELGSVLAPRNMDSKDPGQSKRCWASKLPHGDPRRSRQTLRADPRDLPCPSPGSKLPMREKHSVHAAFAIPAWSGRWKTEGLQHEPGPHCMSWAVSPRFWGPLCVCLCWSWYLTSSQPSADWERLVSQNWQLYIPECGIHTQPTLPHLGHSYNRSPQNVSNSMGAAESGASSGQSQGTVGAPAGTLADALKEDGARHTELNTRRVLCG